MFECIHTEYLALDEVKQSLCCYYHHGYRITNLILKWPHNHNADIPNNSVKLDIHIFNEFNNMYWFKKSLTHHSNKIYFRLHASWTFLVLQQQQNLGQRFGTSKMHSNRPVAYAAVHSKAVVLLLLTFCLLLLPLWESVIVLCFVVRYFMSILVLQLSWWGRESWLLCLICLLGCLVMVEWLFLAVPWVVCGLWLWYFLIILTYYFQIL